MLPFKKISEFGVQSSDESQDILDVSDPNSGIFDHENDEAKSANVGKKSDKVEKIRKEIEALTLDITQTERELEKHHIIYEEQGARPKTKSRTTKDDKQSASQTGEGRKGSNDKSKHKSKWVKTSAKKKTKAKKVR